MLLIGYATLVAMLGIGFTVGWMVCQPDAADTTRMVSALTSVFLAVFLTFPPISIALVIVTRRNWLHFGVIARIFGLLPAVVTACILGCIGVVVLSINATIW